MLLAIDIGNTAITIGVFNGESLRAHWSIATDVENLVDEYAILLLNLLRTEELESKDIDEAILGSVVPSLTPVFQNVCRRYFKVTPMVVDPGVKTGLRILYDSPRDVGADRVIDAVAAIKLYGPPLIVVDFGTATVFDAIIEGRRLRGRRDRPRHRHRHGGAVRADGEAAAHRAGAAEDGDRQDDGDGDAIGHRLRLRGADRGHRRPHEGGAGAAT